MKGTCDSHLSLKGFQGFEETFKTILKAFQRIFKGLQKVFLSH
jgi:hypothetical protein